MTVEEIVILLVEDDEDDAMLARVRLGRAGVRVPVRHVVRAEEALEEVAAHPEKQWVVLTDLALPGTDGFEVVRRLAGTHPVYVLTSSLRQRDRDLALSSGARGFFSKPLTARDLAAIREIHA
ncbi:MAG: response regulator [Planctomycetota bacterium]